MLFLPKAPPLFENIKTTNLRLPDILNKLGATSFTGYLNFIFPSSTTFMVFESGKLGIILLEEQNGSRQTSLDALISLAMQMLSINSGSISAYKLSNNLGNRIRAFLESKAVYMARELEQLNIRDVLEKIKADRISGCLRIYTANRSALIFYNDGNPQGFFHDGSHDLEKTAMESQKIASLPGARIDLFSTQGVKDHMETDLLELINIQKLWDCAVAHHQTKQRPEHPK